MMRLPMVRSCWSERAAADASPRSGRPCGVAGAAARARIREAMRRRTVTRRPEANCYYGIMTEKLTHFDERGAARMVDVAGKAETHRVATAKGAIRMRPETLALVTSGTSKKGDVLGVARIAAIQAAKRTSELIPLCHPVPLTSVAVEFALDENASSVECRATVDCEARTGVEIEALTPGRVGLLNIYDICKTRRHDS